MADGAGPPSSAKPKDEKEKEQGEEEGKKREERPPIGVTIRWEPLHHARLWQLLKVLQVLKCVKSTPPMWKRLVLPARWWYIEYKKAACSFRMFERSCLRQCRLFMFIRHYASCEVSCGMLTKVCRARISFKLNYPVFGCTFHKGMQLMSIFNGHFYLELDFKKLEIQLATEIQDLTCILFCTCKCIFLFNF